MHCGPLSEEMSVGIQTKLCESKVGVGTRDSCSVGHEYGFLPPCVA